MITENPTKRKLAYDTAEDLSLSAITAGLLRNIWRAMPFMAAGFVLGAAIGFAIYLTKKPYWNIEMSAFSTHIPNRRAAEAIDELGNHIRWKGVHKLAQALNMTAEDADKIGGLEGVNNLLLDGERFGTQNDEGPNNPFAIRASVADTNIVPALERGIVYYFNNLPYAKERVAQDTVTHARHVVTLGREIAYLNSVKEDIQQAIRAGKVGAVPELAALAEQTWRLEEMKRVWETNQLLYKNDLQILRPFVVHVKPSGPKISAHLVIGALIGLIAGLVIGLRRKRPAAVLANN